MQKVSLILLLFVTFMIGQDRDMFFGLFPAFSPEEYANLPKPEKGLVSVELDSELWEKITKANIISTIKNSFPRSSNGYEERYLNKKNEFGEDEDTYERIDYYVTHSDSQIKSFAEVQDIMQELRATKILKLPTLKYLVEIFELFMQDIEQNIQELNDGDGSEYKHITYEAKNYHRLIDKYTNVTITQEMIASLKKVEALKKREYKKYLAMPQLMGNRDERDIIKDIAANDSDLQLLIQRHNKLLGVIPPEILMDIEDERGVDRKKLEEKIKKGEYEEPQPLNKQKVFELKSLNKQIYQKQTQMNQNIPYTQAFFNLKRLGLDLALLGQEIYFLERQYEIQKVEKMNQAQLTQYVIEHSSCSKEQLRQIEEYYNENQEGFGGRCPDPSCSERVVEMAKKGFYAENRLFHPTGDRWYQCNYGLGLSSEFEGIHLGYYDTILGVIEGRVRGLYNVVQAFKRNDIPALVKSLYAFGPRKTGEGILIEEIIEAIKQAYRIDDKKIQELAEQARKEQEEEELKKLRDM